MLNLRLPIVTALSLLAAAALVPAVASAADPACGAVLTHSIRLHHAMDCSGVNSSGLVIGKDGVTVDLAGHAIAGPGQAAGYYYGVENSDGYADVTVKNGTIENYRFGAFAENAVNNTFKGLHVILEGAFQNIGIEAYAGLNTRILNNKVSHSGAGTSIYLDYSAGSLASGNTASDSDLAIYEYQGTKNHFVDNTQSSPRPTSEGVDDTSGSYHDLYRDNTFNGGAYGFKIDYPVGTKLVGNTANGNSTNGFDFANNYGPANYLTASGNTANNNGQYGFYSPYPAVGPNNHARNNGTRNCFGVSCG